MKVEDLVIGKTYLDKETNRKLIYILDRSKYCKHQLTPHVFIYPLDGSLTAFSQIKIEEAISEYEKPFKKSGEFYCCVHTDVPPRSFLDRLIGYCTVHYSKTAQELDIVSIPPELERKLKKVKVKFEIEEIQE